MTGLERFQKLLESASKGDHVGILLKDLQKNEVAKGDELTAAC